MAVDGWHWAAASIVAIVLFVLVLLWYDILRERPNLSTGQATVRALPSLLVVAIGFLLALFLPLWAGGVLIMLPLIVLLVMAMAN